MNNCLFLFQNVLPSSNLNMIRKVLLVLSILFFCVWTAYSQSDNRSSASLLKAANKGDSQSQALLAYRLKEGGGVSKDLVEAKKWAQIASQSRNGLGFWLLAQMSREAGESPTGYRKYLESAMSCNYPLALAFFARLYETGSEDFGIEKDEFMALELYRAAAKRGNQIILFDRPVTLAGVIVGELLSGHMSIKMEHVAEIVVVEADLAIRGCLGDRGVRPMIQGVGGIDDRVGG